MTTCFCTNKEERPTNSHIIKKDTYYRKRAEILIEGVWSGTICDMNRPYDVMIVDNKYSLPMDAQPIIKDFHGSAVLVNEYQYGALLAKSVSLYHSPSVGIIFQINSNEYSINDDIVLYT